EPRSSACPLSETNAECWASSCCARVTAACRPSPVNVVSLYTNVIGAGLAGRDVRREGGAAVALPGVGGTTTRRGWSSVIPWCCMGSTPNDSLYSPGANLCSVTMTQAPVSSAVAVANTWPSDCTLTLAFGGACPANTDDPCGSILTTSKLESGLSPFSALTAAASDRPARGGS